MGSIVLVEFLRAAAGVRSDGDAKLMIDAAAEIERLQLQVAELRAFVRGMAINCQKAADALGDPHA